ncbi:MAG: rRNA pseudouridine synthase [Coprobacter sp.]|nr:rRNA pseudouridine synthase [Coprobacter sp.]
MEKEQRPRRPRIGENRGYTAQENGKYERVNYSRYDNSENSYNQRPYYENRQPGRYNNRYVPSGNSTDNSSTPGYNTSDNYNKDYNSVQENTERTYNSERNYNSDNSYNRYNSYSRNYNRYDNQNGYNRYNNYKPYNRNNDERGYNGNTYGERSTSYRPGSNRTMGGYTGRSGYNRPYGMGVQNHRRPQRMPMQPRRVVYDESIDPNEPIRLNKFLANAGLCSRREADEYIQNGEIKVNGEVVTELGTKITRNDVITHNDKVVMLEHKIYVLLNKPKDCVTTSDDPQGRLTVMDIVRNACSERIYPVGRLDRNTTGVLLLTNDGDLASKLTHPKYVKKKIYHVWLDKDISEDDLQRIADGIELEDGPIHADAISYANETDKNQVGIEIHSGRNRVVRRIFESLGYRVVKLDRVYFAGLTKKNLPRGRWRHLTQQEVNFLKMGSFE